MNYFLWLTNQALLLTNLFVYIYKGILKLLNYWFAPALNPNFFSKELYAPEPFEIPLFLILSIIFVIIIFVLRFTSFWQGPMLRRTASRISKWIIFLALLLFFFINIGSYPMKNNTQFIENLVDPKNSIFILAGYLITIALITIIAYVFRRKRVLLFVFILIAIALFTFEPGFPSSAHDTSFFIGPIYEIAHGKTIFTTTSSQYGFLSILTLSFLSEIKKFNPFYLPFLTWILYIVQYFICFNIIYKSSRSIVLGLIGLFSILTINYFSLFHLPNTFPQIGPMRWLPLIVSLFLVQRSKNLTDLKLIFWLSLLSLWNVEAGIALFLSYLFTLFLLTVVGTISKQRVVSSILLLVGFNLVIIIVLNIIHLLFGRQTIDFFAAFARLREFAVAGVAMIPIPWQTHFWFVLLVYFASVIYFFRTINNQQLTILLFSANLSLFASVYYVGRSHPHNLFHISIFFLLNTFLLINEIFRNHLLKHVSKKISLTTIYLLLATFSIVIPAFNRKQALASMIKSKFDRLNKARIFKPELEQQVKQYYHLETQLINQYLTDDEILVLSVDDTYLFYLVNKKNLLLDNPQSGIASISKADLNLALKKAYKTCPQKIAASCSLFDLCPEPQTFNHQAVNIQKILLDSLQWGCRIKYKPLKCTNKLCISRA